MGVSSKLGRRLLFICELKLKVNATMSNLVFLIVYFDHSEKLFELIRCGSPFQHV